MTTGAARAVLYRQEALPIFQNRVYATEAEAKACQKGDICLIEDLVTGLVHNAAFCPELVVYDAYYQNEQGVSPLFRSHLEVVADIIIQYMGVSKLVEVGCGKGLFLENLLAKGVDITGFDPVYEGNNPRILRQYFGPEFNIRAKGFVMRHVLEHVPNPYEFLVNLRDANKGGGLIYIEAPCFDWICKYRAWFSVFYEHVSYFRLSDFHRMFGKIVKSGRLFGGQYLYVVADLASLTPPHIDPSDRVNFPSDFADGLSTLLKSGPCAIWGGSSKGVIFAVLTSRRGQSIQTVIDINPVKQDKYLPATGLLVQSPEQAMKILPAGSTIYVMNSNYLEEIKDMSHHAYNYIVIDHTHI